MKKTHRRALIVLIAIMTLAITTATVNAASTVTTVNMSKASVTMAIGKYESLKIDCTGSAPKKSDIHWKSSNTNVASVSSNGLVKAKKAGTTTVSAEVNGKTAACTVTVKTSSKWLNTDEAYTELNRYRKAKGLKALKKDAGLERIARIRAEEMAKTGKCSHTRPNGKSGLTLIKGRKHKGENIAMGQKTCAQVSKAWYGSKSHRDNMLRKPFKKVGIACYEYNGVTYWAQAYSS